MDFDKVRAAGVEEISVSDSFVVDIEPLSHVSERESSANSRTSRNHSRKGSIRGGGEKKINSTAANGAAAAVEASTTATFHGGGSAPENPVVVALGAIDHVTNPKTHHQITIKKGSLSPPANSKHSGKRSGFRHSRLAWSTDPRKILLFFATLSSMGTALLIYFTVSMNKLNDDRLE